MFEAAYRKTLLILTLAIALVVALLGLVAEEDLREKLGPAFYVIGFAISGCVLLVLAGYVWDRALVKGLKTLRDTAQTAPQTSDSEPEPVAPEDGEHDEIIGLARKIERMAKSLQKVEASYRGIVEDQVDLICRYRADGKLTFVNGAYARAFGRKRIELVGQSFPLLDAGRIASEESCTHEGELPLADGRRAWMQWTQRAIKDANGVILEYQAVGHDITTRKEAEAALRRAKEAAEAADRAKSEFLAVVSHEIRTPINGVIGFADMLSASELTTEQREHVALISTSGHALAKLIGDILDLAKIESGRIEIERAPFSLHECIEDVCAFFALKARASGIKLEHAIEPGVPALVLGDEARLRQILTNLVGNAVKFTEHGQVTVALASAKGSATDRGRRAVRLFFTITDTGVGIAPAMIEKLFRPFSQVDSSPQRRRDGTGLGLVISKRLCELMGGSISVQSQLGEGSVFRFTLQVDSEPDDAKSANP